MDWFTIDSLVILKAKRELVSLQLRFSYEEYQSPVLVAILQSNLSTLRTVVLQIHYYQGEEIAIEDSVLELLQSSYNCRYTIIFSERWSLFNKDDVWSDITNLAVKYNGHTSKSKAGEWCTTFQRQVGSLTKAAISH